MAAVFIWFKDIMLYTHTDLFFLILIDENYVILYELPKTGLKKKSCISPSGEVTIILYWSVSSLGSKPLGSLDWFRR